MFMKMFFSSKLNTNSIAIIINTINTKLIIILINGVRSKEIKLLIIKMIETIQKSANKYFALVISSSNFENGNFKSISTPAKK